MEETTLKQQGDKICLDDVEQVLKDLNIELNQELKEEIVECYPERSRGSDDNWTIIVEDMVYDRI